MAIYEYYCPACREKFEQRRPMSEATAEVQCREGHRVERTITAFAMSRGDTATSVMEAPAAAGGCCGGGGCACGH